MVLAFLKNPVAGEKFGGTNSIPPMKTFSIRVSLGAAAALAISVVTLSAQTVTYPRVIDSGMATPKILSITVQDATVIAEPTYDLFSGRRMDRDLLDDKTSYTVTRTNGSAPTLVNVRRKSKPWGITVRGTSLNNAPDGVDDAKRSPFRHEILFEFDRVIQPGEDLRITFADPAIGQVAFNFEQKSRRSPTIHSSHIGWRPADPAKLAELSFWLPAGSNYGIYDIAQDFPGGTIPNFQIIRADNGQTVGVSGPVQLWVDPYVKDGENNPDWYETRPNGSGEVSYAYDPSAAYGLGNPLPDENFWVERENGTGPIKAVKLNPAKTFVYRIDLSALTTPGEYKIYIPGLGVSYPFTIDNRIWRDVANVTLGGLYNHRKGTALQGWRHGYNRPRAFHPAEGSVFELTSVPHIFHGEAPISGFAGIGINDAYNLYRTGGTLNSAWGGWMDAGDWDNRIQHAEIVYTLLDLYEIIPGYFDNSGNQFSLPDSESVLPDPIPGGSHDYANLPAIVDEAVWGIDFWRRSQVTSGAEKGAIYPAVEHANFGGDTPSWQTTSNIYVLAPDPVSNFTYATIAAKAAIVLGKFNPALQTLYRTSAIDAFDWAEDNAWQNGIYTDGSAASVSDSFMQWLEDWYTNHKFPGDAPKIASELAKARTKIAESLVEQRFSAAGTLYRLTGDSTYRDIVEATTSIPADKTSAELDAWELFGHWEVFLTRNQSVAVYDKIAPSLIRSSYSYFVEPALTRYGFGNSRHNWTSLDWGNGVVPRLQSISMIRGMLVDPGFEDDYLGAIGTGLSFVLGGNQVNKSLTTGLGYDTVRWVLHADSGREGTPPPDGVSIYGFSRAEQFTFNRWGSLFNSEPFSDLYDKYLTDPTAVVETSRSIYPDKTTWPAWENLVEHRGVVHHMEYTVQQMMPMFALSSFLDSLAGGNVLPPLPPAGYANVPTYSGSTGGGGGGGGGTGSPGTTTVEAELGAVGGGTVIQSNNAGYNGTGYVNFSGNGGFLEFTNVDGGSGGTAQMVIRYALGNSPRTVNLIVNGATQSLTFPGTGGWTIWSDLTVPIALNAGAGNTVRIQSTGQDAGNVDSVTFDVPQVIVPVLTRVEAEDYVAFSDTTTANQGGANYRNDAVDIQTTTDAGGGYNVGYIVSGEWLEYDLGASPGGTMDLKFRVATTKSARQFEVRINGSSVGTVNVPYTGGWQTFADVELNDVTLPASGNLTLRVQATTSSWNFNWFEMLTPGS